jgi:hypothetical protein
MTRIREALLLGLAMGCSVGSLHAQGAESDRIGFEAYVLAGARGLPGETHPYLGVDGALTRGALRIGAQTLLGSGNGYASALAWAGGGWQLQPHPRIELRLAAGPGLYWERRGATRETRSTFVPVLFGMGITPLGPLQLALGFAAFAGSYSGPDVAASIPARGLRLMLGVGL